MAYADHQSRVSEEVVSAACRAATSAPDLRADRIASGKALVAAGGPDPRDIADKIISRILGDSVR